MQLEWTRAQSELKDVLMEPNSEGPDTCYWIYSLGNVDRWRHMTIITPGLYGNEFPKTYGHYHPPNTLETYKHIEGEGVLMLQKKHFDNGKWTPNQVDEVLFVKFEVGDEMIIPYLYGHSWTNVGKTPLISFDDWTHKHSPADYNEIKSLHGMSFYVINEDGVKFVPNPNYVYLPEPKIVSAKEQQKIFMSEMT